MRYDKIRFLGVVFASLPLMLAAQTTSQTLSLANDPTPEASTRPNSVRRSRAAEALSVLGNVNVQSEADLQRVVEVVERQILGDSRLMPCDLHVKIDGGKTSLEGYCLLSEQKQTVLDDLRRAGASEVADHVAVGGIGGDQPFAIVQNEAIHVTAKPDPHTEQLTEWPVGSVIYLLQQQGDAFLALGPDGYAGFVGAGGIKRVSAGEIKNDGAKPSVLASLPASSGSLDETQASSRLQKSEGPNPSSATGSGRENGGPNRNSTSNGHESEGPNPTPRLAGSSVPRSSNLTKAGASSPLNENGGANPTLAPHASEIESAISSASKLLGTKYVWGGIDASGIDCSGLTHLAYQSIGVFLPRDGGQQALAGRLVATRWHRDNLRRGDLLFFAGRRGTISHVAIYLGNGEFLEAADGKVQLSSFDPGSPNYRAKRVESFCLAKRILE